MRKTILFLVLIACFSGIKAQKHTSVLDIENNDDYSSFSMLDSSVKNYSVFFTGENHNFRTSNYKLQLKMLKYLYHKTGVRHLFLEFGVSRGWLVNSYVQTGDSTIFKVLEDYSYDEYALLYKGLMEFNKTLPDDKKIMVHGIDIERSFSTPIKAMSMLLPKEKAPASIALNIETLKSLSGKVDDDHTEEEEEDDENNKLSYYNYNYNNGSRYNTDNTLKIIIDDYDSLRSIYQTYLGDNAPLFDEMVQGVKAEILRNKYINDGAMQSFIFREQFLYDHLLSLMKKYPSEKFYGQFGRCHTPVNAQDKWCDFYFFNSLASRLNDSQEEELKNKVLSIGVYYPESTTFEITASFTDELNTLFEKNGKEGIKLIQIDQKDSLFKGVYNKYQFLIVNYDAYKIENNVLANNFNEDTYKDEFSYGFMFPNIEAHIGYLFMNLKNLNQTFETFGLPVPSSPQMIYGGAFTLYEDWFLYGSISYHVLPKTVNRYNDSTELSFNGSFIKGYFGYEVTASSKFNITPRIGIGYGKINFNQKFDQNIQNSNGGLSIFEGNTYDNLNYFKTAILIDPSIDIRYNIGYIAIGLNAGYQIDISDRTWNSDYSGYLPNAPKTSLSGFYTMLTLSLFYSH